MVYHRLYEPPLVCITLILRLYTMFEYLAEISSNAKSKFGRWLSTVLFFHAY